MDFVNTLIGGKPAPNRCAPPSSQTEPFCAAAGIWLRALVTFLLIFSLQPVWAQSPEEAVETDGAGKAHPDRIIIKSKKGLESAVKSLHNQLGFEVRRTFPRFGNIQVVQLPKGTNAKEAIKQYTRSGLV